MHVEAMSDHLLQVREFALQEVRGSDDFAQNVLRWLGQLEELLAGCRLAQAGTIAMLRGSVMAAGRGEIPQGISVRGRATRSKALAAVSRNALQRATDLVSTLIAENQPRLSEAERVAAQVIAAALSLGLVATRKEDSSNTDYLKSIRRALGSHNALESAVIHLDGLVGVHDALVLLDRALALNADRPAKEALSAAQALSGSSRPTAGSEH